MNEVPPSPFKLRALARSTVAEIYRRGLFGAGGSAPRGTLRGIDVLDPGVVQQKLNRTTKIHWSQRGWSPDLASPVTFFEKLALARFFAPVPMPSPADKLGVGAFIPPEFGDEVGTIPPVWTGFEPIDRALIDRLGLPSGRYYAKSSGGTGRNIAFTVPLDDDAAVRLATMSAGWLTAPHGLRAGEWWYGLFRQKNFIEPDLAPEAGSLTDWKFHIGGGRVLAVQIDHDRHANHVQTLYTADFKHIPEALFFKPGPPEPEPPLFRRMREIALAIAAPFEYARVDLYTASGQFYLGEITLAPMGGLRPPRSEALDRRLGGAWSQGLFAGAAGA